MKAVLACVLSLGIVACTTPQKGGDRGHFPNVPGSGGSPSVDGGVRQKTCGDVLCDPNATCSGVGDAAKCACLQGFEGDGKRCDDVNECADPALNDCDPNAMCDNRPGRFLCTCNDGFLGNGRSCLGVDECQGVTNACDPNAVCVDRNPGFGCECRAGFVGDELQGCGDLDECKNAALFSCATNAHCENTFGGFDCRCDAGFMGDGNAACRALCDVARADRGVCAAEGVCRVDGVAARCDACAAGFTGDGKTCSPRTCGAACDGKGTDDAAKAVCAADGTCTCAPGYTGPVGSCTDVDECAAPDACGANAACTDLDGGHLCTCKPGFARDAAGICVDVDECGAVPAPCHPDATCKNSTPDAAGPGYTCTCKPGFKGDGTVCVDVDECLTASGGCATNAACVNQRGSSSCECRAPLVGEPRSCHCDLSGLWAMRQDLDVCWKGRSVLEGTDQDLISAGDMEASVWELQEITYDGSQMKVRRKGCGADNAPDLLSPLFRETYSSYVPFGTFDPIGLQGNDVFDEPGLVPGAAFVTPSTVAVIGIDLGADPLNAPWPAAFSDVPENKWLDPDGDGEPGLTFWPRVPSEVTDSGSAHYRYIPIRPAIGGSSFFADQRAGCVSVAARVITHLDGEVESCDVLSGVVVNEKTEGRVHGCTIVDKGTCGAVNPNDPNDCSGWRKDVSCTAADWRAAAACTDADVGRLDDDQNQRQDSYATFRMIRIGELGQDKTCADVRGALPALDHSTPTLSCTTPP